MRRLAQPGSHLPAVEMKSHWVLYILSCRRDLCILQVLGSLMEPRPHPLRSTMPQGRTQNSHSKSHMSKHLPQHWRVMWSGPVTEWNPFSCCMDQLFPSLIPAPHSAHSGLHSLFLPYTSVLIFLISWYPSPRYIAKPLCLKSCPVITVWLNTHLWDKICGKHYVSCQNWGRVSSDDLKYRSAVKCRIAEQEGIQTIAAKLKKTAMAAKVGRGEREHCVTVDSEAEGTGTHYILENMIQTLFFRWNKAPPKFRLIHLWMAITTCRFEYGNHW